MFLKKLWENEAMGEWKVVSFYNDKINTVNWSIVVKFLSRELLLSCFDLSLVDIHFLVRSKKKQRQLELLYLTFRTYLDREFCTYQGIASGATGLTSFPGSSLFLVATGLKATYGNGTYSTYNFVSCEWPWTAVEYVIKLSEWNSSSLIRN